MFVGEEWGVRGHWGPRVVVETRSMGSFAKVVVGILGRLPRLHLRIDCLAE